MDPNGVAAIQEALRRRAGLGNSSAGVGAPAMNAPMSPTTMQGMTPTPPPNPMTQGMGVPAGSTPSDGAISAMNKAQPGESQMIVKALISRMNKMPPAGA